MGIIKRHPLKLRKGEKVWPITAVIPIKTKLLPVTPNFSAINNGIKPFKASNINTKIPNLAPITLNTLVAPVFLLPSFLISIPFKFATYNPLGRLPNKYEIITNIKTFSIFPP